MKISGVGKIESNINPDNNDPNQTFERNREMDRKSTEWERFFKETGLDKERLKEIRLKKIGFGAILADEIKKLDEDKNN